MECRVFACSIFSPHNLTGTFFLDFFSFYSVQNFFSSLFSLYEFLPRPLSLFLNLLCCHRVSEFVYDLLVQLYSSISVNSGF